MLEDKPRGRILLEDGTSLVSVQKIVRDILKGDGVCDGVKTVKNAETEAYHLHYGKDLGVDTDDIEGLSVVHADQTEDDIDQLFFRLENSPRFEDTDVAMSRIRMEVEFFTRTQNIVFLLKVCELIDRFKREGVVWGVGRGSACASYLLYLLEVHDVNPIRFGIPFSELSKETSDDEE